MTINSDPIELFPTEISQYVFSFLDVKSLALSGQVNSQWRNITSDEVLWNKFTKEMNFIGKIDRKKQLIFQLQQQKPRSNDAIIDHIQRFLDKVSLNQASRFRCTIGSGSLYRTITIEIYRARLGYVNNVFAIKDDCYANSLGEGALNRNKSITPKEFAQKTSYLCYFGHTTSQLMNKKNPERLYSIPGNSFLSSPCLYKARLRFPKLADMEARNPSDMEIKIQELLKVKVLSLNDEENHKIALPNEPSSQFPCAAITTIGIMKYFLTQMKY
jgi:F-box-like